MGGGDRRYNSLNRCQEDIKKMFPMSECRIPGDKVMSFSRQVMSVCKVVRHVRPHKDLWQIKTLKLNWYGHLRRLTALVIIIFFFLLYLVILHWNIYLQSTCAEHSHMLLCLAVVSKCLPCHCSIPLIIFSLCFRYHYTKKLLWKGNNSQIPVGRNQMHVAR